MLRTTFNTLGAKLISAFVIVAVLSGMVFYFSSQFSFKAITLNALPSQQIVADAGLKGRALLIAALEFTGTGRDEALDKFDETNYFLPAILSQLEDLANNPSEEEVYQGLGEAILKLQHVVQLIIESHTQTQNFLKNQHRLEAELNILSVAINEILIEDILEEAQLRDFQEHSDITLRAKESITQFFQKALLLQIESIEYASSDEANSTTEYLVAEIEFREGLENLDILMKAHSPHGGEETESVLSLIELAKELEASGRNVILSHRASLTLLRELMILEDQLNVALKAANQLVEEKVTSTLEITARNTIIGALIVTGVSILAGVAISNTIAKPIVHLVKVTDQLAGGNLEARAKVTSTDEIGNLASSFNQMAKQLVDSLKILESQNAELERFTYTVSHDLKSPLITIRGFMGLLQNDVAAGDGKRVKSDLLQINSAVDQMERLLADLLNLSRLGLVAGPSEEIDLNELISEAVNLAQGQIEAAGIKTIIQSDLPKIYGDRTRLLEVFQNLIENAAKYMGDHPEPRIDIGFQNNGKIPLFQVSDNGMGIEPLYQEKIFNLFERLDSGSEGTGIGLALVKRIIEIHGGRIWVESKGLGKGSSFLFTLPLTRKED